MNSKNKQKSLGQLIGDSLIGMVPVLILSFVVLCVFNLNALIKAIPNIFSLKTDATTPSINMLLKSTFEQTSKIPYINTIGTFIFWFMAGIIIFLAFLFVSSLFFTARNDADMIKKYQLPIYLRKPQLAEKLLVRWILFICFIAVALALFISICFYWLPLANSLFVAGFLNARHILPWLNTIASVLILGIFLSFNLFLIRLSWRVYGQL